MVGTAATGRDAFKAMTTFGSGPIVSDFIRACIIPVIQYGLPVCGGLVNLEEKKKINSILSRLARLAGVEKCVFLSQFHSLIERSRLKLATNIHRECAPKIYATRNVVVKSRCRTVLRQKFCQTFEC